MKKITIKFEVAITEEAYVRIIEKSSKDEKNVPASCRQVEERRTAIACRDFLTELLGDPGSEVVSTQVSDTEVDLSEKKEKSEEKENEISSR